MADRCAVADALLLLSPLRVTLFGGGGGACRQNGGGGSAERLRWRGFGGVAGFSAAVRVRWWWCVGRW